MAIATAATAASRLRGQAARVRDWQAFHFEVFTSVARLMHGVADGAILPLLA
jgi:hypothetical protein